MSYLFTITKPDPSVTLSLEKEGDEYIFELIHEEDSGGSGTCLELSRKELKQLFEAIKQELAKSK